MPHTIGKNLRSSGKKLKKLARFMEDLQAQVLVDRGLRKYLEDSTFRIGTNEHGQIVFVIEFSPGTQPSGDGYNALKHFYGKKVKHNEPIIRKGGGKHHVVFENSLSFEVRLTFSVVIEGDDTSIEDQTGGGRE